MFKYFILYNFIDCSRRLKQTDDQAWISTSGFLSMALAFNIATILFAFFGNFFPKLEIPYVIHILIGIPWIICFLYLYMNNVLYSYVIKNRTKIITLKWIFLFWGYYIITIVFYMYSMKFYRDAIF